MDSFYELNKNLGNLLGIGEDEQSYFHATCGGAAARTSNIWKFPKLKRDVWTADDDQTIREFYEDHVKVDGYEWQTNCERIDFLLEYLFQNINEHIRKDYPYLQLQRFVRQGSSRDGLKVGAADEFDAVLPIKFVGFTTEVVEYPKNDLPPGTAELKVTTNAGDIKPPRLIEERSDGKYINTKILHENIFNKIIDKVLDRYSRDNVKARAQNRTVFFKIRRQSHSPAIILRLDVPDENISISVDIVPGYLINGSIYNLKKFLVTRWIHETFNDTLVVRHPNPEMSWRISLSHFEMKVFEFFQESEDTKAHRLITACRILKTLRTFDRQSGSSQFKSILKSYHIKNVLLYSLLFITLEKANIRSVSDALAHLIAVLKMALSERNLPQFFTDKLALEKFFPEEVPYETTENLLIEKTESSLDIARSDMKFILRLHGMGEVWNMDCREIEYFFENRIKKRADDSLGTKLLSYTVAGIKLAEKSENTRQQRDDKALTEAVVEECSDDFRSSVQKAEENLKQIGTAVAVGFAVFNALSENNPQRRALAGENAEHDDHGRERQDQCNQQ